MTNPMLAELDEVVRLSEMATQGEWLVATHGMPEDHWIVADCGGSKSSLPNPLVVAEICDYCKPAEDDAAYIAALSNYFRTHHATLADMAKRLEAAERDARRYRWLRVANFDEAMRALFAEETRTVRNAEKMLDAAIDAAIDATQEGEG